MSEEENSGEEPLPTPIDADDDSSAGLPFLGDETIKILIPNLLPKSSSTSRQGSAPPLDLEEMQRLFPDLEVLELLGAGGMGAVFKARQPKLDRMVAVKILNLALSGDPKFVARFEREAKAMAKLDHPNIVTIHDIGEREGHYFFIMEYVDGGDLHKLIQEKKVDPATVLELIPQICEAVQFAHDEGITHRDIKPANILLDSKGRVKIADFGLAKILECGADSNLTMSGVGMGTPFYMAPEQMKSAETVDRRADIYSLGVVIYQLLTGNLPQGDFPPPSKSSPSVTPSMDSAIMRAMAQDPELRFQEVKELFEALEIVRESRRSKSHGGGKGFFVAGMVLSVVLLAGLSLVALWLNPGQKSRPISTVAPLEVPSELAAMRERGGRLRGWGQTLHGASPMALLEGIALDNIVRVYGSIGGLIAQDTEGLVRRGRMWRWADGVYARDIDVLDIYVSAEGNVISNHPVMRELGRRIKKPAVSARGGSNRMVAVAEDGSVQLVFHSDIETPAHRQLARELAAMNDVVAIELSSKTAIGLRGDGTVFTWVDDPVAGPPTRLMEAPDTVRDIVAIQAGRSFLALDNKGKVHVWGGENDILHGLDMPSDLGTAFQIRTNSRGVYAAQMADGRWRAWGVDDQHGIIDFINTEMGPAISLDFAFSDIQSSAVVWWVDPVQAEQNAAGQVTLVDPAPTIDLPANLAKMKESGGRLRVWGRTPGDQDLAEATGSVPAKNLVRVRGLTGDFIALDTDGKICRGDISKWALMQPARDIDKMETYVTPEGQVISRNPVMKKLALRIKKPVVSAKSGSFRLAALAHDGSVQLVFDESIEKESHRHLARKLAEMNDVVAIELANSVGIGLRRDGTVFTWGDDSRPGPPSRIEEAPDTVRDIVSVQASFSFLALDRKGKVHAWGEYFAVHPLNGLDVPADLGQAYQIRASNASGYYAAQMADGSWRAWGADRGGVVEFINTKLGPAIDLDFTFQANVNHGVVWWIEPVEK